MNVAASIALGVAGLGAAALAASVIVTRAATRRAEAAVPPDGGFIEVEGARLHYIDRGSGPTLLFVHGLSGQLRNFTYALTERLESDFRIVAVDRPGAGYSVPTGPAQPDLVGQADILARFIAALGLERPLLVGHSLGGALALRVALDHPGSISGIALLSPLTQQQDELPEAFAKLNIRSSFVRRLIASTVAVPAGLRNAAATQALIFAPEPAPADFATRGGGLLALRPAAIFAASSEVSAGSGEVAVQIGRYPMIVMPVSILFGADDRILDPARHGAATAALIPGARYDTVPGGHMFPLTRPEGDCHLDSGASAGGVPTGVRGLLLAMHAVAIQRRHPGAVGDKASDLILDAFERLGLPRSTLSHRLATRTPCIELARATR